jgi:hypothetical protein
MLRVKLADAGEFSQLKTSVKTIQIFPPTSVEQTAGGGNRTPR